MMDLTYFINRHVSGVEYYEDATSMQITPLQQRHESNITRYMVIGF